MPSFLLFLNLGVRRASGSLPPGDTILERELDEVFGTALAIQLYKTVRTYGIGKLQPSQEAYNTHCARVPCLDVADVKVL